MSNSARPRRRPPTMLPHPWDSPGKNTGVRCHCLLRFTPWSYIKQTCDDLKCCGVLQCVGARSVLHPWALLEEGTFLFFYLYMFPEIKWRLDGLLPQRFLMIVNSNALVKMLHYRGKHSILG